MVCSEQIVPIEPPEPGSPAPLLRSLPPPPGTAAGSQPTMDWGAAGFPMRTASEETGGDGPKK